MLNIICPLSHRYRETIQKLCSKVGISNYDILDPKSHNLDRSFKYVLFIGPVPHGLEKINAVKVWEVRAPDPELESELKKAIFQTFKDIATYTIANQDNSTTMKKDIPRLKDLEEYLQDYRGQVIEIKMPDGRIVGVFPDGEKLSVDYPIAIHASTILNLSKLYELFGATGIRIKDL